MLVGDLAIEGVHLVELRLVFWKGVGLDHEAEVIVLGLVLDALDAKKDQPAENGESKRNAVFVEITLFQRDPRPDHGDARCKQQDRIAESKPDVLNVVRPGAVRRTKANEKIGREDRAK